MGKTITFFDLEVSELDGKILDIGCLTDKNRKFHKNSIDDFTELINESNYLSGHNILKHDLEYLNKSVRDKIKKREKNY